VKGDLFRSRLMTVIEALSHGAQPMSGSFSTPASPPNTGAAAQARIANAARHVQG